MMVSLTTRVLLARAAQGYVGERKGFSREEIVKRINEIKYLSAQKKVPKLTLRKEIIHLENKLQQVFELEKRIWQQEKTESAKVLLLKKEISLLKQRMASSEDKDMQKKVDTLSHLLGESLAKQAIIEDIALTKKFSEDHKKTIRQQQQRPELIASLLERLQGIRREVVHAENLDPSLALKMQEKISLIEEKLRQQLPGGRLSVPVSPEEKPQHTMFFNPPSPQPIGIDEMALQRELPLPPPPRMTE